MISTMGNGYTFPLQTIVFLSVVVAVYKKLGIPLIRPSNSSDGNFSVYGDDIIVVREAYDEVMSMLKSIGCIPNEGKSFCYGFFRESCGGDFFNGHPVRGVYSKSLNSPHQIYSLHNQLLMWSYRHKIPLTGTLRLLRSFVKRRPIPWSADISGGLWGIPHEITIAKQSYRYECLVVKPRVRDANSITDDGYAIQHAALKGALSSGVGTVKGSNEPKYPCGYLTERSANIVLVSKIRRHPNPFWVPPTFTSLFHVKTTDSLQYWADMLYSV